MTREIGTDVCAVFHSVENEPEGFVTTRNVHDCVVIAIWGTNAAGKEGCVVAHLSSHQYEVGQKVQNNSYTQKVRNFTREYQNNMQSMAATNYWDRPYHLKDAMNMRLGSNLALVSLTNETGSSGATITVDIKNRKMYLGTENDISPQNDLGDASSVADFQRHMSQQNNRGCCIIL